MKNRFLLMISLAISSFSFAQTTPSFGIKAGVTSAGIRGDAIGNLDKLLDFTNGMVSKSNHTGFFVGVNSAIPLGENFSVEPGIYFTQKGQEIRGNLSGKVGDVIGASAKAVLQANYIDVPVLLKATIGGLQVFAGPQVSYLTNADLKTSAGVLGINLLNKTIDASSVLNKWDAAVTGGLGYQFSNGINISASYDYGLLKADANRNAAAFNHAVKVGIGVNF